MSLRSSSEPGARSPESVKNGAKSNPRSSAARGFLRSVSRAFLAEAPSPLFAEDTAWPNRTPGSSGICEDSLRKKSEATLSIPRYR
jgi:hypothetical protein